MAQFKTRARTLDMLGKQQIAGIPTALHELFKNAYDAYAESVEVDYFRKYNILLLRDDGIGMSKADFENRWLTLATESKLEIAGNEVPIAVKGKKRRPIMGEKGIGRLAIATIGPIVLVLSRPRSTDGSSHKITVSLIHWGVFELPLIDLDQINVPLTEVTSTEEITSKLIKRLATEIIENLEALAAAPIKKSISAIIKELTNWEPPVERLVSLESGASLKTGQSGTHFIVSNVDENLKLDIEGSDTEKGATNLQRMLLGFSNSLNAEKPSPIKTEFRDHLLDGRTIERIGSQEFFTKADYAVADHRIEGSFDKFGNFSGSISIYQQQPKEFEMVLNTSGEELKCGPFSLGFSYVQGSRQDTQVPFDTHTSLKNKLDQIGGLYIYKNGIRVLPYGNSDYDFLEIERRRTLSAGYYFFSYRRMFGAIHLDANSNQMLREKAGREGFQSNRAYREFRDNLMRFFEVLAGQFFREDGIYAEEWQKTRDQLKKEYAVAKKRRQTARKSRKEFAANLAGFFEKVDQDQHLTKFQELCDSVDDRLSILTRDYSVEEAASEFIKLEQETENLMRLALGSFQVGRPRAVGINKLLAREWNTYQVVYNDVVMPEHAKARAHLEKTVGEVARNAKVHLDARIRLQASVSAVREFSFTKVEDQRQTTKTALSKTESYVQSELQDARKSMQSLRDEIDKELIEIEVGEYDSLEVSDIRSRLEARLTNSAEEIREKLSVIQAQLNKVDVDSIDATLGSDQSIAALETELEVLKDDYKESLDLVQLGMAVSVVHHEFESNVKSVRNSLQTMQKWAAQNDQLKKIYNDIRNGFDHLDNYLSLFTPLDKRLRRRKTKITGEAILDFLNDLFGERFDRHQIKIEIKDGFLEQSVDSYASLIYPVFVNLIDNSIHWLSHKESDNRKIYLDAIDEGFAIGDNGPGISEKDKPYIFEFGYSRKLGGQGMGLYIAKTSLNKEGFDISIDEQYHQGAKFRIHILE